jgi:radical SAM superfamily enzyme YgiQ (UPF0313 family)
MRNIYFIEAKSPGSHIFSKFHLPRLGTILLATILKNNGYNTKVFIEDIAEPDWKTLDKADMICISSITSTSPRAYSIAKRFNKLNIPVVMGGVHPTFMPQESLRHGADYVVRGEGEETLLKLVEHLNAGTMNLGQIKGLSFKTKLGGIIHNPSQGLISDLDAAPIPDFNLVHKWENIKHVPIATSRGCPFGCRFCSVIPMFGRKYRFKKVDRIIREIRLAISQNPEARIFFVDDNFAANKKRAKELLRAIIDAGLKFRWSAQVRTDVAYDHKLIRLMVQTGCTVVQVGFESVNPATLKDFNKKQELEESINCIETLKSYGIEIHGMFVLGADTDNVNTIQETAEFAIQYDISSIQFLMLTPLPGTPVFQEFLEQGRLLHTDWSKYDAHHVVFKPKLMTPLELHTGTLKAMLKYYSWPYILKHLAQGEFLYAAAGLYGRRAIKKALSRTRAYFNSIEFAVPADNKIIY